MASNAIALITKYATKAWDEIYCAESRSAVFDGEKDMFQFTGTKTVKVAKTQVSGLRNYQRANGSVAGDFGGDGHSTEDAVGYGYGFQQGIASLVWEEFTLRYERGIQIRVDAADNEETDGLAIASVLKELSRTQIIPEIDAFVFSEIAKKAGWVNTTAIADPVAGQLGYTVNGPIYHLNLGLLTLENAQVPSSNLKIFVSNSFRNKLRNTNELIRAIDPSQKRDGVKYSIEEYEGHELISVPDTRFRTLCKLLNTVTGGYSWDDGSQQIDFIICDPSKIAHVVKYDQVKTFGPGVVQDYNGYKINALVYHDLFVLDNKRPGIYVHTSNVAAAAPDLKFDYDANLNVLTAVYLTGNMPGVMYTHLYACPTANVPAALGGDVPAQAIAIGPNFPLSALVPESDTATYKLLGAVGGKVTIISSATLTVAAAA